MMQKYHNTRQQKMSCRGRLWIVLGDYERRYKGFFGQNRQKVRHSGGGIRLKKSQIGLKKSV